MAETLRNELKDSLETIKKEKLDRWGREKVAQLEKQDDNGTCIIYSAALPTILAYNPPHTTLLTKPATVHTDTGITRVDQQHPVKVTSATGMVIDSDAYVMPGLGENLLSVHEIVKQKGPVLLKKQGAYVYTTQLCKILKLP